MNRKIPFCVGVLVLASLATVGVTPSEAAVVARAKTTTKAAKAAAAKRATFPREAAKVFRDLYPLVRFTSLED